MRMKTKIGIILLVEAVLVVAVTWLVLSTGHF